LYRVVTMTNNRLTSKRCIMLVGCLLVGCSSVLVRALESPERHAFLSKSRMEERKLSNDEEWFIEHGPTYATKASKKVLIEHGKKIGKGELKPKYHEDTGEVLVTHGPYNSDEETTDRRHHYEMGTVLITHHKGVQGGKGKGTKSKGPVKRPPAKGKGKDSKSKGKGTKSQGKTKMPPPKGKGKGSKSKGKGSKSKGKGTKSKGKGTLRKKKNVDMSLIVAVASFTSFICPLAY
jgi:hypothetical protein